MPAFHLSRPPTVFHDTAGYRGTTKSSIKGEIDPRPTSLAYHTPK